MRLPTLRRRPAPWLATFADMMALLMCFFVLLLSFAEMDVLKYKQVAGAMKLAFGVQRIVKATEIPKGTSVIAKQYSPGTPTEVTQGAPDTTCRRCLASGRSGLVPLGNARHRAGLRGIFEPVTGRIRQAPATGGYSGRTLLPFR